MLAVAITSNVRLAGAPGNVLLRPKQSGLRKDSVVNVSQVLTIDKAFLTGRVRMLAPAKLQEIDEGLRLVLAL